MSKNLTKTNNTIKKVIARLCKCFAIFAVFLFAGVFANAQEVDAGAYHNTPYGSGITVSGSEIHVTSEDNPYFRMYSNCDCWTFGVNNYWVKIDGTTVEIQSINLDGGYMDSYIKIIISKTATEIKKEGLSLRESPSILLILSKTFYD